MEAMKDRDGQYFLRDIIHIDGVYFGGELNGDRAGRGSENKVPFVAALEMSGENRPIHLKLNRVSGFLSDTIEAWSVDKIAPGSVVPLEWTGRHMLSAAPPQALCLPIRGSVG